MLSIFPPQKQHRGRRSARLTSGGFTLVELLTVMAIIVILVGLLFAALKFARNSSAQARTKAQLDTLRGMLAELDSANNLSQPPTAWLWYDKFSSPTYDDAPYRTSTKPQPSGYPQPTGNFFPDFWRYPYGLPQNQVGSNNYGWDSLDSPGDVGNDNPGPQTVQRNASFAVLNTQLAMQMLAAIPGNRAAIQKLPANSVMMPVWQASAPYMPPQIGSSLLGLLKDDTTDPTWTGGNAYYVQGMHVTYQGDTFVCVYSSPSAMHSGTAPVIGNNSGNSAIWLDESNNGTTTTTPRGVPLLLDGWGNPIIFVPASGLHVKLLNGLGSYQPANAQQDYIIVSPEGHVMNQGTANAYCDRPGRPFFASAGPDGDFTKGDDNLYSFND